MDGLVDVLVFSSEVGLRKPDPRIYLLACRGLGVAPTDCVFVGDGNHRELSGAAAVGMTSVLIIDPAEEGEMLRMDAETWDGPTIFSVPEVRTLLRA
jgi:putative hydrolase of the HAD superfamily